MSISLKKVIDFLAKNKESIKKYLIENEEAVG